MLLQKERGFFGSISHALFGGDDVEDKVDRAADRTRANASSAADDVSNKVYNRVCMQFSMFPMQGVNRQNKC